MARLSVNVDHVATLRQQRRTKYPDPLFAAFLAESGGADGITVHLRQDRKHIQDRDVVLLRQAVTTHLTIEMAPSMAVFNVVLKAMPDMITLVPERTGELTTETGFDLETDAAQIDGVVKAIQNNSIALSLFVEPSDKNVKIASEIGADFIELNTTKYVDAESFEREIEELERIEKVAAAATKQKLGVAVGHALDYHNVANLAAIRDVEEFSIGHAIVCRAVLVGFERAVREMKELIDNASRK